MSYKDFDDWFFEFESYCMRCERFYDDVGNTVRYSIKNHAIDTKSLVKWLRAAFEAGKEA